MLIDGLVFYCELGVCLIVIIIFNWFFKNDVCMLIYCYVDLCLKEVFGCNL